ncbi:MAG TPA: TetR/AcrR family transcriptional regulator [Chloroflexota bacterium]
MARLDIRGMRREQILDAAERLVLKHGWADITLARLCEEADVTNGVLTYHFKDKEDIEQALWERVNKRWFALLEERFTAATSVREVIDTYTHEALTGNDRDLEVYYLLLIDHMARAIHDPEVAARLQAKFAHAREYWTSQLQRVGDIAPGLDLATAAGVVRAVQLGAVLSRAALGIPKSSAFAAEIARLLNSYLTQPAPEACPR